MISFFRTSFPVVEHPFLFFVYFGKVILSRDVRGQEFVPGFILLPLSWNKGTTGKGIIFVLG